MVPVSLIGTFGAMYLLDYTLDNFSLMALTIATGFVVDDAIVVMENTTRHIEAGMTRMRAALLGAQEVGFTVVSMSLSLVAVFIPFMFAGGIVGRIFREFTVTLSVAILISLVISLTTTPMMCSLLLERDGARKPSRFARGIRARLRAPAARLRRTRSTGRCDHPRTMLLMLIATIGLNIYLYVVIPKGFFPQQDTGQLQGGIRGDATSSFQLMKRKLQEVAHIVQEDPAVSTVTGSVGSGGFGPFGGGGANANVTIALKPLSERRISADQVIARLRPKLARVTGVSTFLQAVQDVRGGGRSANSQYQYTLLGDDLDRIADLVAKAAPRDAGHAGNHRRRHRHAAGRTGGRPDRGSRQRIAPGAHRNSDRQRAGRCVRPGAGIEHLQSLQSAAIPRGHGSGAGVLAEPRGAARNCTSAPPAAP